jgi:hypothetical protein
LAALDEAVRDENSLGSFVVDEGLRLETMEAKPLTGDALRGSYRCGCEALTISVLGDPVADACGLDAPRMMLLKFSVPTRLPAASTMTIGSAVPFSALGGSPVRRAPGLRR